jgi:hypothetical protein
MKMTINDLGKIAYDTYCQKVGWKSFRGEPLPEWKEVPPNIQEAWEGATAEVWSTLMQARMLPHLE